MDANNRNHWFLDPGPLSTWIEQFAADLAAQRYTPLTIEGYTASARHFVAWLGSAGISIDVSAASRSHCMPKIRGMKFPSADLFGRASCRRRTPYIYSPGEIRRLIDAAHRLGPDDTIRPLSYATMFGLIAATGMRVSEAIAIRLPDVTDDGLIICPDQVQEEPNAAAPPDDPIRLGRIPRDSTKGGKSERCAFHITSEETRGNKARCATQGLLP